jgi:hypothetical protein
MGASVFALVFIGWPNLFSDQELLFHNLISEMPVERKNDGRAPIETETRMPCPNEENECENPRPDPVFPLGSFPSEGRGFFLEGNVLSYKAKKKKPQEGEWREIVSQFVDGDRPKLEDAFEILGALLKNTNRTQTPPNQLIRSHGFFDLQNAESEARIARAKSNTKFERGLLPWQKYTCSKSGFVWVLLREYPSGIWGTEGEFIFMDFEEP